MTIPAFTPEPAERIASFRPYFFAQLNQKIATLKQKNVDVIRIDIGSPDLPPAKFIVDVLEKSARRADTHGYTPYGGSPQFKNAISIYYQQRFGVKIDPQKETLVLLGSKEGLFNLSQVLINPGDVALIPDPAYPVYKDGGMIAGAEVFSLPLLKENGFLPDLDVIPQNVLQRTKILWLDYPNNPTGAVAPLEFFQKVIEFGHRHHIIIAHDAPYVEVCYGGYVAPSILQVDGAREVAVEFNSLSKSYNMAGWRLGMAVGNAQIIQYLGIYKSQMDSSHFQPILEAGIAAMTGDQSWLSERNQIYEYRRDIVLSALRSVGFHADTPPAAIYVWARLPDGFTDSLSFCDRLLTETGVSATPGVVFGEYGEGYLRISLGTSTDRMKVAMERLKEWVNKL